MTEIRNAEIANAETSNSIMSPLVGSEQQTSVQAPAMDVNSVVPPEIQQTAQNLSGSLYGSGFVEGGENQANRLSQELFNYDQQLEKGYSPYPKKDFYVENPADLYKTGSSYAGGMGGVSGSVGKAVSGAELAYQTAVSAVLDKFTSFYKMKQDEETANKDRAYQEKMDSFEIELQLKKLTGGTVTHPFTGEKINVPGPKGTQTDRDRSSIESQIKKDVANGMTPEQLIPRYKDVADYSTIMGIYNGVYEGSTVSPWGGAERPEAEYRAYYDIDKSTSGNTDTAESWTTLVADSTDPATGIYDVEKAEKILTRDEGALKANGYNTDLLWEWHNKEKERQNPQKKENFWSKFGNNKSVNTSQEIQNIAPHLAPLQQFGFNPLLEAQLTSTEGMTPLTEEQLKSGVAGLKF